jgi:translation initiation factor 2 alpha subunit (eIF-2alpha)
MVVTDILKKADTLIERICDRIKGDTGKVVVYTVYRITRIGGALALLFYVGTEAFNIVAALL